MSEWINSQKWISSHVSDHSGFQYRQNLLLKLISAGCKNKCLLKRTYSSLFQSLESSLHSFYRITNDYLKLTKQIFDTASTKEMDINIFKDVTSECFILGIICFDLLLNNDLILLYIGHEALWCHRRFLLFTFYEYFIKSHCTNFRSIALLRQIWDYKYSHRNNDGVPFEKDIKVEDSSSESMRIRLVCFEKDLLRRCADDLQQSKAAAKHKVWIENVLKMKLS